MGLIIGVGGTKPTFAYDYYYGIEWDSTVSNPKHELAKWSCTNLCRFNL